MSDIKRNERRRKHYKMLREAGYDRETATRKKILMAVCTRIFIYMKKSRLPL